LYETGDTTAAKVIAWRAGPEHGYGVAEDCATTGPRNHVHWRQRDSGLPERILRCQALCYI